MVKQILLTLLYALALFVALALISVVLIYMLLWLVWYACPSLRC